MIFMKKGKKYLWGIVVITAMLFSCGEPVVLDPLTTAFLSQKKDADYVAKTNQTMREVKTWYEKHYASEKSTIRIKVMGAGEKEYVIEYPTPFVKSPDLLSINDATVAGRVVVNHLEIMADGKLLWNGKQENIDDIYLSISKVRETTPSEHYIFLSVDEDVLFKDYLKIKEVLYRYRDQLAYEYYDGTYIDLKNDEQDKINQIYIISHKEYIYDADQVKR